MLGTSATSADARGRLLSDGERDYTWNAADQLVKVSRHDGASVTSVFGADGVRRTRTEHSADGAETVTRFIDSWSEERDGKLVRYIFHAGQRIVRLGSDPVDDGIVTKSKLATMAPRDEQRRPTTWLIVLALLAASLLACGARVTRRRSRHAGTFVAAATARRLAPAAFVVAAIGLVAMSTAPAATAIAVVLLGALSVARNSVVARATRTVVAGVAALGIVAACNGDDGAAAQHASHRTVGELTDADTFIVTDLLGSVLGEASFKGESKTTFATYPFGATRYDTTSASWKYASSPRDVAVGLDHMGARFYASELGIWTSPDPIALTDPTRLVTADFAAANPYAYANQTPLIAADRDGHFWHIIVGALVGGVIGAGVELYAQYHEHGRIEDVGRVGAAFAGGAIAGAITTAVPGIAGAGVGSAAGGITRRLIQSNGQSAGTLHDVVTDAATGMVTCGVGKASGGALKAIAPKVGTGAGALARTVNAAGTEGEVAKQELINLASVQRTAHILDGDSSGGGHLWPGAAGKTAFPPSWSPDQIMHHVSDIATDPGVNWVQQTGRPGELFTRSGEPARFFAIGEREGLQIKVVLEPAGEGIITAHPTGVP
jgi:RHS repeat-associated protein